MDRPRRIDDLADELISHILSFILGSEPSSTDTSPTNSHVSDVPNGSSINAHGETSDLDRFRLVCTRFRRIATPWKFPRFVLRFSRDGFRRLEDLLDMQLACHVRSFTYMVRPFYQGSDWSPVLKAVESQNLAISQVHKSRREDQEYIITGGHDMLLLRRAISAFSSLQQIKLLRLQDGADEQLLDYIREQSSAETVYLDWEPACTRAVTSLATSLLESNCSAIRFVGPQINPESAAKLAQTPSLTLSTLGARLTSLDVTFHSSKDMTSSIKSVSSVFHDFFLSAKNLTSIKLVEKAPDSQHSGWRLDSEEVISLIRRHRRQLRDIALADVYLRNGGRWRDILSVLHDEMDQVECIYLRDIDYADHLDSDSPDTNGHASTSSTSVLSVVPEPTLALPPYRTSFTVDYPPFSPCGSTRRSFSETTLERLRALTVDDLGDNGVSVRREQGLLWEAWVLSSPRNMLRQRQ
ncbi:F-box domain protein [Aspergillus nomiae NRRL 13137]|uniref:F-box domain protein n=1 Tax=Aspergillus nomiae NRRL (strain ATCC 15546 / NRRL 13137 / CBS 260.88 / M93) TaxID=1509407 RepID=A0A0L1ITP7_ASPN3|nr:F-box domain protein [Aspergillus nomiae NRRL 13137]KNG82864.1 F-box domain protein [Aspergillus nomiae NRRL 13137]